MYVEPGHARNWLIPQMLATYDISARHGHRQSKSGQPGPRVFSYLFEVREATLCRLSIQSKQSRLAENDIEEIACDHNFQVVITDEAIDCMT